MANLMYAGHCRGPRLKPELETRKSKLVPYKCGNDANQLFPLPVKLIFPHERGDISKSLPFLFFSDGASGDSKARSVVEIMTSPDLRLPSAQEYLVPVSHGLASAVEVIGVIRSEYGWERRLFCISRPEARRSRAPERFHASRPT
jgi:hypothetical protein